VKFGANILILTLVLTTSISGFAQNGDISPFYTETHQADRMVQLYPNPATDYLTVKLQTPNAATVQLAMHSVIGNELQLEREQVDNYEVRLRVRDLPSGYYFLSIKEENSGLKASYKFLKR